MDSSQKKIPKKTKEEDPALSKNKGRNIRFRQRIQEDKEREQELKEWLQRNAHQS